ncbi:sensor histidine kinase [Cumulibacter manganitolerans]|uniref:sensor histidine kinase n=1 Tax=Cumulibacter manganitolerans TaxID=1884992 RepID=UPI0012949D92|nr:ATP-binding protein [Cumulibacter manganitolerans]
MSKPLFSRVENRLRTSGTTEPEAGRIGVLVWTWCTFRLVAVALAVFEALITARGELPALILVAAICIETAAILWLLYARRSQPPWQLVVLDYVLALVVASSALWLHLTDSRLPWYLILLVSSAALLAVRPIKQLLLGVLLVPLAVLYSLGRFHDRAWTDPRTIVVGFLSGVLLFMVIPMVINHALSLTRDLDRSRDENAVLIAAAAVANERAAQRVLLHDTSGLLAMLANTTDPALIDILRERARSMSREMRDALYDATSHAKPAKSLPEVLSGVAREFNDLPIEQNTLMAKNVQLTSESAGTIWSALRTILDNVRTHAHASLVTVHASADRGRWEVSVRDDGVGFDPDTTPKGFGLTDQVEAQCALVGITTRIDSAPGEGTVVVLRGVSALPTSTPVAEQSASELRFTRSGAASRIQRPRPPGRDGQQPRGDGRQQPSGRGRPQLGGRYRQDAGSVGSA